MRQTSSARAGSDGGIVRPSALRPRAQPCTPSQDQPANSSRLGFKSRPTALDTSTLVAVSRWMVHVHVLLRVLGEFRLERLIDPPV